MILTKANLTLFRGKTLDFIFLLSLLAMKREVEHQLAGTIREKKCKTLEVKDASLLNMRSYTADQFGMLTCLGGVCLYGPSLS
ncbi:hypothetical protein KSZ73_02775 [Parabacteroides distasonis]|nr:hypothetical protein [Parabacteroides distasonis]